MAIRQKGSAWQVDVTWKGLRAPRVSVPTRDEALKVEAQFKADLMAGREITVEGADKARLKATRASTRTMGHLYEYTMRRRWRGTKAERSSEINARVCVEFLGWDTPVSEITADTVVRMADEWAEQGNANGTINRKLAALRVMLKFAVEQGDLAELPKWEKRKEYEGRLRWFSDEEEQSLLMFFADDPQMHDLLVLGLDTGFRQAELLNLKIKDFSFSTGKLTTWETKGNKPRSVPLTPRARATVMRLRGNRSDYEPLFSAPYTQSQIAHRMKAWKRFRNLPADDEACFHSTRHTCCSRMVQAGVSLPVVQQWMGHKDIKTTMRYAHLAPNALDGALQALSGWGSAKLAAE